jgi:PAS domain S-box-containing protein
MRLSITQKLVIGSVFSFSLILLLHFFYFKTLNNYHHLIDEYQKNDEKILKLEEIISILKDAETGQRGFLLTGNEKYLEPFEQAEKKIWKTIAECEDLFEERQSYLTAIKQKVREEIASIRETITLYKQGKGSESLIIVNSDKGKTIMDEIRKKINIIQKYQKSSKRRLLYKLDEKSSDNYLLIILATFVTIVILSLGLVQMVSEIKRRVRAEMDLFRMNMELESSNEEFRTLNEELNASMEEVNSINEALNDTNKELQESNEQVKRFSEEVKSKNIRLNDLNKDLVRISMELQDLYNNVPMANHSIDKNGVYVKVNDTEIDWLGYSREELLGKVKFEEIVADRDKEVFRNAFGLLKEEGNLKDLELSLVKKDGSELPIILNSSAIYSDGGFQMSRSSYIDNSQLKKAFDLLEEQKKDMESFSYSISHDLRAPLRAISGFSRILKDREAITNDPESTRLLNIVNENAVTMGKLIDDLLEFSKLGRKALAKANVDSKRIVEHFMEEQRKIYAPLDFKTSVSDLPPITVDENLFRQVWYNLLSNAFKYSSKKPQPEIKVGCTESEKEYQFFVADNGAGFDMKYQDKLFGVFQRLHSAEEFEGTGVGLAIVNKIVKGHGGKVWAQSEQGKGSIFYFTVPKLSSTVSNW